MTVQIPNGVMQGMAFQVMAPAPLVNPQQMMMQQQQAAAQQAAAQQAAVAAAAEKAKAEAIAASQKRRDDEAAAVKAKNAAGELKAAAGRGYSGWRVPAPAVGLSGGAGWRAGEEYVVLFFGKVEAIDSFVVPNAAVGTPFVAMEPALLEATINVGSNWADGQAVRLDYSANEVRTHEHEQTATCRSHCRSTAAPLLLHCCSTAASSQADSAPPIPTPSQSSLTELDWSKYAGQKITLRQADNGFATDCTPEQAVFSNLVLTQGGALGYPQCTVRLHTDRYF